MLPHDYPTGTKEATIVSMYLSSYRHLRFHQTPIGLANRAQRKHGRRRAACEAAATEIIDLLRDGGPFLLSAKSRDVPELAEWTAVSNLNEIVLHVDRHERTAVIWVN